MFYCAAALPDYFARERYSWGLPTFESWDKEPPSIGLTAYKLNDPNIPAAWRYMSEGLSLSPTQRGSTYAPETPARRQVADAEAAPPIPEQFPRPRRNINAAPLMGPPAGSAANPYLVLSSPVAPSPQQQYRNSYEAGPSTSSGRLPYRRARVPSPMDEDEEEEYPTGYGR